MHRRAVRLGVVALLLAGGVGAGFATRELHRQLNALAKAGREVGASIDAMTTDVADIAAAQAAYVAPGQSPAAASAQVTSLVQQIDSTTAAIRPKLRSV